MPREWALSWPTTIYKPLKQIEPLALFTWQNSGSPNALHEALDAGTECPVLQKQPHLSSWNTARRSLMVTCTGLKHREVCKTRRPADAHHRMLPEHPVLLVKHTGRSQIAPDAWTGATLRPVLTVRCLTLAPQHTGRTASTSGASTASVWWVVLSEKHSRDFSKLPTGAIEKICTSFSQKALNHFLWKS